MSTTDDASAATGTNKSAAVTRLPLPTFTASRNHGDRSTSYAESSTSSSRWSAANRPNHSPSGLRASSSVAGSDDSKQDRPVSGSFMKRDRNRTSGGFLLEPTTNSSRLSKSILSRTHNDVKGKRNSGISDLSIPRKRNRQSAIEQDPGLRASPLSVEVKPEQDDQQNVHGSNVDSIKTSHGSSTLQNGYGGSPASRGSATPSLGLDTDPAKIVEMALKLSEGRRRQASGRRFVSSDVQGRRIVSTVSSRQLRTPSKGLNQLVTSPAILSTSPAPIPSQDSTAEENQDSMVLDDPFSTPSKFVADTVENDVEISRATSARVQKAKIYLELAYEHRRLLSHLPPIRTPGSRTRTGDIEPEHKIYNPLQYVRNRKLRLREKTGINAEAEGWFDIEKVRAWVDAVTTDHPETSHNSLECVRLPTLSLREDEEDDRQSPNAPSSPMSPKQVPSKSRRPKSDWVTHPGEFLADAFWLEQGLNKTKIQDRDNRPIYPPNTTFQFSGWRKRQAIDVPERLQEPTPPPETATDKKTEPPLDAAPKLPEFRSAHKKDKDASRARKRSKLIKARSDSRRRKVALMDSSSDSDFRDSSVSPSRKPGDRDRARGRKRQTNKFDLPDGDPFGQPVATIHGEADTQDRNEADQSGYDSKRPSIDHSRFANYLRSNSVLKPSSRDRGRSRGDTKKHHFFRHSRDERGDGYHTRHSTEDDSTAPNSPANYVLPSITINLDAPLSRSPSPTKKLKPGLFQSLKDKSRHLEHNKVDTNDFAVSHSASHSRTNSVDGSKSRDSSAHVSRGTSPFTKFRRESIPPDELLPVNSEHRASTISRRSTRPLSISQDHPSRIRGMFKGGRIAELVGNEVSRVGEYIWKRDVPPAYRHQMSGSDASFQNYDASDTDESVQNGYTQKLPTRDQPHSVLMQANGGGRQSLDGSRSKEKTLHNPNLPSFTSPFQSDRDKQEQQKQSLSIPGKPSESGDHISWQAAQHRDRSKSPRLDRLALPKLDTGAPRSVDLERRNSYGFGAALTRSQSASRAFNKAIDPRGSQAGSARGSIVGFQNQFRQSIDRGVKQTASGDITKRDLSRIEALLLISAVKAKNLHASYDKVSAKPSQTVLGALGPRKAYLNKQQLLQVRKRDEHVIAARSMIAHLSYQSEQINRQLYDFSDNVVTHLQEEIQSLEDQIENTITPRVRIAADNAGELSVKLTTTSTQAVKSLQDIISEAFRLRRRGPFRWLRLVWYTVIEWIVVGLLWFIWAIVTFVRLFLGIFKGIGRVVRFALWID